MIKDIFVVLGITTLAIGLSLGTWGTSLIPIEANFLAICLLLFINIFQALRYAIWLAFVKEGYQQQAALARFVFYPIMLLLAWLFVGTEVPWNKIVGMVLIVAGVIALEFRPRFATKTPW